MTAGAAAFDPVAESYDATFTDTPLGRRQREMVWRIVGPLVGPGARVLELGCGTGEDALWMAERGAEVLATDPSSAMLDVARRKTAAARDAGRRVTFRALAIEALPDAASAMGLFDLVLSDFGALNCVADPGPLGPALGGLLRPGGRAALCFMPPFCLVQTVAALLGGRPRLALSRLWPGARIVGIGGGAGVATRFHSVGALARALGPWLTVEAVYAVGLFTPPTTLQAFFQRHRHLFERLEPLEDALAPRYPWNRMGDHALLVLRRAP